MLSVAHQCKCIYFLHLYPAALTLINIKQSPVNLVWKAGSIVLEKSFIMKKVIIAIAAGCCFQLAAAQVKEGKIIYERKTNMHKRLPPENENMKSMIPEFSTGYNLNAVLWKAGIAKQVFKNKKGEFRLQVYDILSQNIGVSRNSSQNYIEDASSNVLKRFWQLSFTYNISRFAGKNIAAPGSRNSNIQVIQQGKSQ